MAGRSCVSGRTKRTPFVAPLEGAAVLTLPSPLDRGAVVIPDTIAESRALDGAQDCAPRGVWRAAFLRKAVKA